MARKGSTVRVEVLFDAELDGALLQWLRSVRNTSGTIREVLRWWFVHGAEVERLREYVSQLQAEVEYWRDYYSVDASGSRE